MCPGPAHAHPARSSCLMRSTPASFATSANTTGRVAVVTGANKGIGYFIALQLASSGLFRHLVLACRNRTLGRAATESIRQQLPPTGAASVSFEPLTLGDRDSHSAFRKRMEEEFGKVDVLVNNAAMAFKGSDPTPFKEQCKPTLDVNFHGTVDLTQQLLPLLRKGSDARIVNVASMSGRLSQIRNDELRRRLTSPDLTMEELNGLVDRFKADVTSGVHDSCGWGNSNYGMSKLAVIAATKIWAREEAPHIKVNCCCPGYCDTDMSSHMGPRPPSDGAKNAVLPATMDDCPSGKFFSDYKVSRW